MSLLFFSKYLESDLVQLWFDDSTLSPDQNHFNKRFKLLGLLSTITAYDLVEQAEEIRLLISILDYQHNERILQTNENIQPVKTTDQSNKAGQPLSKENPKTGLISAIQEYTDRYTTTYLKSLSIPALSDLLANQIKKKQIQEETKAFEKEQGSKPKRSCEASLKNHFCFGGLSALSLPTYEVIEIEHINL